MTDQPPTAFPPELWEKITNATDKITRRVIARHRCQDVHAVRWDQPTMLRRIMDPCDACIMWGGEVAGLLEQNKTLQDSVGTVASAGDETLRAGVRRVLAFCITRRDEWSKSTIDGAVARAVAYQCIASELHKVLDEVAD